MKPINLFNHETFLLTILSIILLFATLPIKSQTNQTNQTAIFTYHESQTENPNPPRVYMMYKFDDDTMVVHIIRRNSSAPSNDSVTFLDHYLSLRTIFPDGRVEAIDITLGIQDLNFCILSVRGFVSSPIKIYPVRNHWLLVTYTEAQDLENFFTYNEWAMVVDLSGKIYGKTLLGPAFVDPATNQWYPNQAEVQVNVNRDKGFLRIGPMVNSTNAIWQQFVITDNGEIQKLTEDFIDFPNLLSLQIKPVATVDEGYAIIYANTTNFPPTDPFLPQGAIYAIFLTYGQNIKREPVILYQTQLTGMNFFALGCDIAYVGVGQTCILTVTHNLTTNSSNQGNQETFYIKVDFLSSGSLYGVESLNGTIPTNPGVDEYSIRSLRYGGYLFIGMGKNDADTFIYGYIRGDNDEIYSWDFGNPIQTNFIAASNILSNNTLVIAQPEVEQTWTLITTDLHRFVGEQDHGYANFHINTTTPKINDMITSDTKFLTIQYYDQVDLSTGNIAVFQSDDSGRDIMRQSTSGTDSEHVKLEQDGITVNVTIIESTFSQPGGKYYVSIANNFVKSRTYQEPLYGVQENVWSFATQPKKLKDSKRISGRVRLTVEGTNYLKVVGRQVFYTNLRQELANAIPISLERITTNDNIETDTSVPQKQLLLSIRIEKEKTEQEITAPSAIEDLNTLIKNKPITLIGSGQYTKYLDQDFGYKQSSNFFDVTGQYMLGIFISTCVFLLLYLWARQRYAEGKNVVILQFGLVIFDFVMDILFASEKARAIGNFLLVLSVVIVVVSVVTSMVLAFTIIAKENLNEEFSKWSRNHTKVVAIFTILAGADIEMLNVLQSKVGGFEIFSAKFSKAASNKIFWGACLNILIEDIPQVIIQIFYNSHKVIRYDIIPILTLSSSCLNLLINITGRIYNAIHIYRDKYEKTDNLIDNDEESFGGLSEMNELNDTNIIKNTRPAVVFLEEKERNPYYPV